MTTKHFDPTSLTSSLLNDEGEEESALLLSLISAEKEINSELSDELVEFAESKLLENLIRLEHDEHKSATTKDEPFAEKRKSVVLAVLEQTYFDEESGELKQRPALWSMKSVIHSQHHYDNQNCNSSSCQKIKVENDDDEHSFSSQHHHPQSVFLSPSQLLRNQNLYNTNSSTGIFRKDSLKKFVAFSL